MELFLNNDNTSQFLALIAHYTRLTSQGRVNLVRLSKAAQQLNEEGTIKLPSIPLLITEEATTLTTTFAIAQYLCTISYTDSILIGKDNQQIGEVLQVFEAARKLTVNELIDMFTKILESKVYLVSNHVTIADLFLYYATYDQVALFTDQDKIGKYIHYFRWFKQVQNLPEILQYNEANGKPIIKPASPFVQLEQKGKGKKQK